MIRFLLALCLIPSLQSAETHVTIDQITAAVCQIETGTIYLAPGKVAGHYLRGEAGEIGPWQTLPAVLRERGFDPLLVKSSTRLAEQAFISQLAYLESKTSSLRDAIAAYHRGLGGRNRKDAKAYAERVINLASTITPTPEKQ